MTSLPTAIDRPVDLPRSTGLPRLAVVTAALAGAGLGAAGLGHGAVAGSWVRAALVATWAVTAGVLAAKGALRLGGVAALAALVGGACAATANDGDLALVHMLVASLTPAVALHLEVVIPDGTLLKPSHRTLVIAGYVMAIATGVALGATDHVPAVPAVATAIVAALLVGLPIAHHRYRSSAGLVRQRLQLVGCATAVIVEVAIVVAALRVLVDWPSHAGEVAAATTALVPIAIAAGRSTKISRNVDRVLVHTVSATGLTAVVVAVYVVVVIGLGRAPADEERALLVLSMVAAAVAAIAYVPARERLAESANRLVYGERHPPDEVLRTWGSRLSRSIPMDELLLQLAESLRKVLVLRRAEIWTGTPDRLELAVSVPDRSAQPLLLEPEEQPVVTRAGVTGNAWLEVWLPALLADRPASQLRVAPAAHSGTLLGLLVVERPADGDAFTEEDDRVLTELARQVGLALHNVQLDSALQESLDNLQRANEDLQASRARIVATGDAERRKIERNLHDGAQQHLVALAVNLRLTKDILADDPAAAAEMLDALADAVKDTIQELRDLAHGIYPPLLMDSGLPEALRAAANRSPLAVSVHADGLGRFPQEVEAAVYFCCLEALQNAAKHAPGAEVVIDVAADEASLSFSVRDDGPGFDVGPATAGHGFVNMSDRVGAIGGTVEWRSAPGGGAAILGTIPLG
ncbi:MAG TPA: histidine kinase [Acidimicrobiales bacterium]|nr:histidine kinase [Acidimicrobiales bacterium]